MISARGLALLFDEPNAAQLGVGTRRYPSAARRLRETPKLDLCTALLASP